MDAWSPLIMNSESHICRVTWLSIKVLPKLDLTHYHLCGIAVSDLCCQTACLWVSGSLRPLSVPSLSAKPWSLVVASQVAYQLVAMVTNLTVYYVYSGAIADEPAWQIFISSQVKVGRRQREDDQLHQERATANWKVSQYSNWTRQISKIQLHPVSEIQVIVIVCEIACNSKISVFLPYFGFTF